MIAQPKILPVDKENPDPEIIATAAGVLLNGGIVVYPADTVYSLAANAFDEKAVRKIFVIKGREVGKPIHVLVKNAEMIEELVEVNSMALKLIRKFYPGFLNLVLKERGKVSSRLSAGTGTLGVRWPDFKLTQQLSVQTDRPYTGTSANPAGGRTPYSIGEVFSQFSLSALSQIDLILDAGTLPKVPPSTVVDLTTEPPRLLREGPISRREIETVLGFALAIA